MFIVVISIIQSCYGDLGTVCTEWSNFPKTGTPPSPRSNPIVVSLSHFSEWRDTLLVIGGRSSKNEYLNDVFVFDTALERWFPFVINGLQPTPSVIDACVFSSDQFVYVWGGKGENGFYNDMWCLDLDSQTWTNIEQSEPIPQARQAAHFTSTNNKGYIFGGRTSDGKTNDVWEFDLRTHKWREVIKETEAKDDNENPPTRSFGGAHALVSDLFIYGGYTSKGAQSFSVYRINTDDPTPQWAKIPFKNKDGTEDVTEPTPRSDAGWCSSGYDSFTFGGTLYEDGDIVYRNDVIVMSFEHATSGEANQYVYYTALTFPNDKKSMSSSPGTGTSNLIDLNQYQRASCGCATNAAGTILYVFGGVADTHVRGDMVKVDISLESGQCSIISPEILSIPSPRTGHRAVKALGRMWVFGGRGGLHNSLLNDLYSFDFTTHRWEQHVPSTLVSPPARELFSMVEHSGRLFIFGGKGSNTVSGEETIENDIWQFTISTQEWSKMEPMSDAVPSSRYSAGILIVKQQIWIYGGRGVGQAVNNELWRFELASRTWQQVELVSDKIDSTNATSLTVMDKEKAAYRHRFNNLHHHSRTPLPNDIYVPVPREEPTLLLTTYRSQDVLLVAGGVSSALHSLLEIDVFSVPKDVKGLKSIKYSEPPKLDKTLYEDMPIYYHSYTTTSETSFVSFGGLDVDNTKSRLNNWNVKDLENVVFQSDEDKNKKRGLGLPFISGGTAVINGRELWLFGGNQVGKKLPSQDQFHNQMYRFSLVDKFGCAPGTYVNAADTANLGCSVCPAGTFGASYNLDSCEECSPGSYNPFTGATKGYHCISCLNGEFNAEKGQAKCKECLPNEYCPIGSTKQDNQPIQIGEDATHQPPPRDTLDKYSMLIMIGPYACGALVGVIIGLILVCCTCSRVKLWNFDLFSSRHNTTLDPITHSAVWVIKKTRLGGFVSIVFICFAVGSIATLFLEFFMNNVTETKTLVAASMENGLGQDVKTGAIRVNFVLYDSVLTCSDAAFGTEGECKGIDIDVQNIISTDSKGNLVPLTPKCTVIQSTNSFRDPTTHCHVSIAAKSATFQYQAAGRNSANNLTTSTEDHRNLDVCPPTFSSLHSQPNSVNASRFLDIHSPSPITPPFIDESASSALIPSISLSVSSDSAYCYSIASSVSTHSGITLPGKSKDAPISQLTTYSINEEGKTMKGTVPTAFNFTLMPSLYTDTKDKTTPGAFVAATNVQQGSANDAGELFMKFGLRSTIQFNRDLNVVLVNHTPRQKLPSFLSNVLSSVSGFLGIFGTIMMVLEIINSLNLKIVNKGRDKLTSTFSGSTINPSRLNGGEDDVYANELVYNQISKRDLDEV
ncbi:hypothetical protein BLNAU_3595 [Blattamonas nauphoetae]|uniref:Tyrosine-protein kinase ephrin type A/B receptor-like domain-containing protein n=1 Tax=Blattamonas nauphoetae TaxID=2049346 RepID=A0ABQ9YCH0_9EUKA|nr:hypothetical protein BLNAU_3595 [Blattamonas nauphoetae]